MRTASIVIATSTIAVGLLVVGRAQSPGTEAFEVASIRRNISGQQQGGGLAAPQPGGRFIAIGATLQRLIGDAYDETYQILGGPDWIDSARFDVNARATSERTPVEIRRMLRSLLAARFNLLAHTEQREMPAYALTVVRADRRLGSKLTASDAKCAEDARTFFPGAPGFPPPCGDFRLGARALTARGVSMTTLARLLGDRAGRPGLDRTGLTGVYDFSLEWSSDIGLNRAPGDSAGADDLRPDGLSLFTALQDQLGLRLDATRAAVPILVVDRAEMPTPD